MILYVVVAVVAAVVVVVGDDMMGFFSTMRINTGTFFLINEATISYCWLILGCTYQLFALGASILTFNHDQVVVGKIVSIGNVFGHFSDEIFEIPS